MKKILALLVAFAMVACLVACATNQQEPGETEEPSPTEENLEEKSENPTPTTDGEAKYVFAVLNCNNVYSFYQATMGGMQQQADLYGDVELVFFDAQDDVGKELDNLQNAITMGVDAVILINVGQEDGDQCVEVAQEAGIPIFAVDRQCPNTTPNGTIATSYTTALLFAENMAEAMGGQGKIAEIQGVLGVSNVTLRHDALMEVLEKNPDMELVDSKVGNFDPATAQTVAMEILSANPDLDAFYTHDDGMAVGVVQAIKDLGMEDQVKIYSIGGDPAAISYVETGEIESVWAILTGWEGAAIVYEAYNYLEGKTVPEFFECPSMGITSENVAEYPGDTAWTSIEFPGLEFPECT